MKVTNHFHIHNRELFSCIKDGRKTLEIRSLDDKIRNIKIGDTICFSYSYKHNNKTTESINKIVSDIFIYDTYEDAYKCSTSHSITGGAMSSYALDLYLRKIYKDEIESGREFVVFQLSR